MTDELGDRMKLYESAEAGRRLMPRLPVIARLDGKAFHTFTRGMVRPYDERMSSLMAKTAKFLATETVACCAYAQSDEITLAWYAPEPKSQIWFDGRVAKMTSVLASMASAYFNKALPWFLPERWSALLPVFDCRVWAVPTIEEAANVFLWREQDATRNAIEAAAQSVYSHNELHGKHGGELQEMLFQKGINFNCYPDFFKKGTYFQRHKVVRPFTTDELELLPAKHAARTNPDLTIERTEYRELVMVPFSRVTNRAAVIFEGADPLPPKETGE